jgi:hypothetical protein
MNVTTELHYNVNSEVSDDAPGWKRLDTLLRRWTVQRLHQEELEQYNELRCALERPVVKIQQHNN